MRVALCPHISVRHFRGGEKWVVELANRLAADGVDVRVNALPYLPDGERRVRVEDVLDGDVPYAEAWRHDLSGVDVAYLFYHPLCRLSFSGQGASVAGIHSWVYVSKRLYERHYGVVPTAVKALYRTLGPLDLGGFDAVHAVTPAFDSPHPDTWYVPNFVDVERFHPGRAPTADRFTVLATAAHIPEKGWDVVRTVASRLPDDVRLLATGSCEDPEVEDLGFLTEDELARAYARAHLVLHPARVDTDSMVINEACASGTPVLTTPIPTHVSENAAVVHRNTVGGFLEAIETVRDEWDEGDGYDLRCRVARWEGETRDVEAVYPRLVRMFRAVADGERPGRGAPVRWAGVDSPPPTEARE